MTQVYGMPDPAATPGPGAEYRFSQIMQLAWARFTASFSSATGYSLLVGLVTIAMVIGIGLVALVFGMICYQILTTGADMDEGNAIILAVVVFGTPALWLFQMLTTVFHEGLRWAILKTYDGHPISWSVILRGFVSPWRWPMIRYAALFSVVAMILTVGQFVFSFLAQGKGIPWLGGSAGHAGLGLLLVAGGDLVTGALQAVTLLIGLFILHSPAPSFAQAVRDHLRVLRLQWQRVVAVVGLYVAASLVLSTPQLLLNTIAQGSPVVGCVAFPFMIADWLLSLYYFFLVTALFRSIHGLPLEPPPAPPPLPVMPFRAGRPVAHILPPRWSPDDWPDDEPTDANNPTPPAPTTVLKALPVDDATPRTPEPDIPTADPPSQDDPNPGAPPWSANR
ncbi:MAG: hypothetical protein GXY74_04365 [Phycisphaerae bacterium]|nr:hypothetical protein [Phycisphaerae bacterium]